ncbi:unnamed protein product [Kuraishia capsulata CBS 1993]|uniref:Lysophospholipase n=1 Tax=Kuraishia capsulata CBS 1993 TaxID=1382522 RepID=W6MHH3_9ASCO|nr:uncharacterized protein KUCA_T00001100001 [Kuraishia capsulata CBS 1993]CDK25133.1 unnamed protein product [Kuraishia capsulata CBS 1993]
MRQSLLNVLLLLLSLAGLVVSYAPTKAHCPKHEQSLLRTAKSLSDDETKWIAKRQKKTTKSFIKFLEGSNLTDFTEYDSVKDLVHSFKKPVTLAAAFSGGGYRAMLNGAGQLAALDSRTEGADEHGLGGLLESLTYISGLSGGSWLLGTVVLNEWASIQSIIDQEKIWNLTSSILYPSTSSTKNLLYFEKLFKAAVSKKEAGFDISAIDIWGLALANQFFPTLEYDNLTWSGVQKLDAFRNHDMPFPVISTNSGPPGSNLSALDAISTEFNPYEFGSWHRYVNSFTDLTYLGTDVVNGKPTGKECTKGFDNAAFIIGSSSDIFVGTGAAILFAGLGAYTALPEVADYLDQLNPEYESYAIYKPSPFYEFDNDLNPFLQVSEILLSADGGSSDEVVPFEPLIQPIRGVSTIFAFDSSADTDENWPDGESLWYTYERLQTYDNGSIPFPEMPTPETFISKGLNKRPTFFGCKADSDVPLVVYVPNINVSHASNVSTSTLSFSDEQKLAFIKNGFEGATRNNLTEDSNYRTCIACASIAKSLQENNIEFGTQCQSCFDDYCYN